MRILTVSDVVVPEFYPRLDPARLPAIDLVVSCGDLPPEYLRYLRNRLDVPLYYVRGNHDLRYDGERLHGCTDLHGQLHPFRGLNILGLEGSMWYNGGAGQYREQQMKIMVQRLRWRIWRLGGVDIVFTHAPPRGVHDAEDRCHRGFETYRRLIQKYRPRYFIHGHIHRLFRDPSERMTLVGSTMVINTYGYHVLEIDAEKGA